MVTNALKELFGGEVSKDGVFVLIIEDNGIYHLHGYSHTDGSKEVSTYQHTIFGYIDKAKPSKEIDIIVKPLSYIDGYTKDVEKLNQFLSSLLSYNQIVIVTNIEIDKITIPKDKYVYVSLADSMNNGIAVGNLGINLIRNMRRYSSTNVEYDPVNKPTDWSYWILNSALTLNPLFYTKDIYKITNGLNEFITLDYPTDDSVGTKTAEALLGHIEPSYVVNDDILKVYDDVYDPKITKLSRLVKFNILNIKKPATTRMFKLYTDISNDSVDLNNDVGTRIPKSNDGVNGNPLVLNIDLNGNVLDVNGEDVISIVKSPGLPMSRYTATLGNFKHFLHQADNDTGMELDITDQLYIKPGKFTQFKYKGTDTIIPLKLGDLGQTYNGNDLELISGVNCPPFKVLKKLERDIISVSIIKEVKFRHMSDQQIQIAALNCGTCDWYLKIVSNYGKGLFYNISNKIL
jgi:hypothetical protein